MIHVEPISVTGQQNYQGQVFPLVLANQSKSADLGESTAWIAERRQSLLDQAATHGVILFRGFPLANANDFDQFVTAFDLENFPYEESLSNAVRVNRTPRVFTANEA